jgi:hypothetical protein
LSKRGFEKFVGLEKRFSRGAPSLSLLKPVPSRFLSNGLSVLDFAPKEGRPSPRGLSPPNRDDEDFPALEKRLSPKGLSLRSPRPLLVFLFSRKDFSAPVLFPKDVFLFPGDFPERAMFLFLVNEDKSMNGDKKISAPTGRGAT